MSSENALRRFRGMEFTVEFLNCNTPEVNGQYKAYVAEADDKVGFTCKLQDHTGFEKVMPDGIFLCGHGATTNYGSIEEMCGVPKPEVMEYAEFSEEGVKGAVTILEHIEKTGIFINDFDPDSDAFDKQNGMEEVKGCSGTSDQRCAF